MAIQSFADANTEKVWRRQHVARLGTDIQRAAQKKLRLLNAAGTLGDLRVPPGNRLKKLTGNRAGQHSIRVNDQFRICFTWTAGGPADVEIVDDHEKGGNAMTKAHDPITPGEILRTEFLEPLEISQYRLAQATGLSQTRIGEIVRGKRRITTETGLRLSRALGTSERFWINIQADHDIDVEHDTHEDDLNRIKSLVS